MRHNCDCVKIPVFDFIKCISKEEFNKLKDKQFYQIVSETQDGKLMVGHYLIKKK